VPAEEGASSSVSKGLSNRRSKSVSNSRSKSALLLLGKSNHTSSTHFILLRISLLSLAMFFISFLSHPTLPTFTCLILTALHPTKRCESYIPTTFDITQRQRYIMFLSQSSLSSCQSCLGCPNLVICFTPGFARAMPADSLYCWPCCIRPGNRGCICPGANTFRVWYMYSCSTSAHHNTADEDLRVPDSPASHS
jgi:hypothetical protein